MCLARLHCVGGIHSNISPLMLVGEIVAFAKIARAMKAARGAKIGATMADMSATATAAITSSKKPLDSSLPSSSKRPKVYSLS